MSKSKKETLFRFKTSRAPQTLSAESRAHYFIEHPDETSGDFFTAIASKPANVSKKEALITAADSFSGNTTKAAIIAIDPTLSEFGLYLIKSKNTLTVAEVNTKISGLTPLSASDRMAAWDSLIYQTIVVGAGAVREAILQLLLADYFVTEFSGMEMTDEALRKWANSRIVVPQSLFDSGSNYHDGETINDSATGEEILTQFVEAAEAKLKGELYTKAAEELEEYKTNFKKTTAELEMTANKTHQANVIASRSSAQREVFTDQKTGFTFNRFKNYTPPVNPYQAPAEIDSGAMAQVLSEETLHLLNKNNLFNAKTFTEMEENLTQQASETHKVLFERTAFHDQKVAVDGTVLSKCGLEHRFNPKYAFMLKLVEKSTDKYGLVMAIDVGSDCLKLDTAIINFKNPINEAFTSKSGSNFKGIFTADLLPSQTVSMGSTSSVEVSGQLIFTNGLILDFSQEMLPKNGFLMSTMTRNTDSTGSGDFDVPSGFGMRRLGIADYRKVEQTLCCYVPGEVAHIENVMAREYKERMTTRSRRSDNKTTTSASTERENMTDTSTSSRFEMQNEVSNVLSESKDRNIATGFNASVSGSKKVPAAGEVNFSLGADFSADFATSSSSETSDSNSTNFAKDITEKAVERVVSKVSEERVTRIIEEFEERNQHGFDNRQGAEHISGVYRWVDKVYKNEVQNYGKRLQYEFMIPEPSAFHLLAKASGASSGTAVPLVKPMDPRTNSFGILAPLRNAAHVLDNNYAQWAAAYGAEVNPPPSKVLTIGKSLVKPQDGSAWHETKVVQDQLVLPQGYGIKKIYVSGMGNGDKTMTEGDDGWDRFIASAAGITQRYWTDTLHKTLFADDWIHPELIRYEGTIPLSVQYVGFDGGIVSFTFELNRKHALMQEWQLETFNRIIDAYEEKLELYKNQLAELEAKKGMLMGDNPAYYRRIEQTVLKKNCIAYLAGNENMGKSFTSGLEVSNNRVRQTQEMDQYAVAVKFFEQAFEWELMDYTFYPFYWADREKWSELYGMENDDALFRAFLRSGMARAVLTVRPGFEEAVMYFMSTGLIWNGGEVPVIGDDLYLSIIDELSNPVYTLEDSWETRVPSSLTLIQAKTIALDADGLPCYCDEEPPTENISTPEVNPLTGLNVHIDGQSSPG